jgi:hypothetical protein
LINEGRGFDPGRKFLLTLRETRFVGVVEGRQDELVSIFKLSDEEFRVDLAEVFCKSGRRNAFLGILMHFRKKRLKFAQYAETMSMT